MLTPTKSGSSGLLVSWMVALGAISLEMAHQLPSTSTLELMGRSLVWTALTFGLRTAVRRFLPRQDALPWQNGVLGLAFMLPMLVDPILRRTEMGGCTLEWELLFGLRNLGIGFVAVAHSTRYASTRYARLAALTSLFLVLFSYTLAYDSGIILLVAVYLIAGSLWLIQFAWHQSSSATRPPLLPTLIALAAIAGIFVVITTGLHLSSSGSRGWLPSSGGSRQSDPRAWNGVGNGEAEVGAVKPTEEIGSAETNFLVESQQMSLYDASNELYGEPRPPKSWRRKVAIKATNVLEAKRELRAGATASGHDFDVLRRPASRKQDRDNEQPRALLYVRGNVPLHLRMQVYDQFDGHLWKEEKGAVCQTTGAVDAVTAENDNWMRLTPDSLFINFGGRETHEVRLGLLKTDRLPLPNDVARFRVGKVNKPDFYKWAQPDILRMDVPDIPVGTRIEIESAVPYSEKIPVSTWTDLRVRQSPHLLRLPDARATDPAIYALARQWTLGKRQGWPQVLAVVQNLRTHYTLDRQAVTPTACDDPLAHFLLKSRRGPDYLFATAAALLLRHLGYAARVVSGFYVRSDSYDRKREDYPVYARDMHFWIEIFSDPEEGRANGWIALEPTPGYFLRPPAPTLWERFWALVHNVRQRLLRAMPRIMVALVFVIVLLRFRFGLYDLLATLVWRLVLWAPPAACLRATIRLLEKRAKWTYLPRPSGQTLARWYATFPTDPANPDEAADLRQLAQIANYFAYAPDPVRADPPWSKDHIRNLCFRIGQNWTHSRLSGSRRDPTTISQSAVNDRATSSHSPLGAQNR